MSKPRRKKSSVNVRIARSPTLLDKHNVIRTIRIRRTGTGRIGGTTTHAATTEETDSRTRTPSNTESHAELDGSSHVNPLEGSVDLSPDVPVGGVEWVAHEQTQPADLGSVDGVAHEQTQPEVARTDKQPYRPIQDWLPHRQAYLDELLRHDGLKGDASNRCSTTGCQNTGHFVCRDCLHGNGHCQGCLIERHQNLPLHRILHWTGLFYEDTTLQALGLVVQLGHNGSSCSCPSPVHNFTIVDISGVHQVNLRYCECHHTVGGSRSHIQLLRVSLFPSTVTLPRKAFTFDVLDTFHLMTLQGKISAYDFYNTLSHKSDNTGLHNLKNCYPQFLTAIRMWRHLKILKRSGRGNDPAGAEATAQGQCAIECPACPQPNRNLPPDWEIAPKDRSWLYSLNLTIDANFRLKNKARGIKNDPPLGDGWAHWVPEQPYQAHLEKHGHHTEPNLCDSDLHAVDHANTRFSQGYTSTGVGGVLCARHSLVRKNGMGNLQKGERYANMDFIVFSGLVGIIVQLLVFSYDIACQWWKNLSKRLSQLPKNMRLNAEQLAAARFVIPKFHIYAHGLSCQSTFSLNFLPFMARTNGEEPERWWAHINPVSMSTKEMGPGARLDTLDDHAVAWNWRKITGMGASLATQLRKAVRMAQEQKGRHAELSRTFPDRVIEQWEAMVAAWNKDPQETNPYAEPIISTSMATLRVELAKEELMRTEETIPHEMSPSAFLQMGLDLEDQQRTLQRYSKDKLTLTKEGDLEERRNVLRWRIQAWIEIRNIYVPALADDQDSNFAVSSTAKATPESMPLKLPSSMTPALRSTCFQGLADIERRLRVAQAHDCLCELRKHLRITMGLKHYKATQIGPSQRAGTRARSLVSRFHEKTQHCAERYRAIYSALSALDPDGEWSVGLRPLAEGDVRPPRKGDDEAEGTRELSWIWRVDRRSGLSDMNSRVEPGQMDDEELNDCLRCEWAKSKARADRWREEVLLLVEEMRRVICFLDWKASWWMAQTTARTNLPQDIADGVEAYAAKQADMNRSLAKAFGARWYPDLRAGNFKVEWPVDYIPVQGSTAGDKMDIIEVENNMTVE